MRRSGHVKGFVEYRCYSDVIQDVYFPVGPAITFLIKSEVKQRKTFTDMFAIDVIALTFQKPLYIIRWIHFTLDLLNKRFISFIIDTNGYWLCIYAI